MRNDTRAYFVAAVTHPDGYNGHEATAYVCFDNERKGLIAVYPHGWHDCPEPLKWEALKINEATLR